MQSSEIVSFLAMTCFLLLRHLNLNHQLFHYIISRYLYTRPVCITWEKQEKYIGSGNVILYLYIIIRIIRSLIIGFGNCGFGNRGRTYGFLAFNHVMLVDIIFVRLPGRGVKLFRRAIGYNSKYIGAINR